MIKRSTVVLTGELDDNRFPVHEKTRPRAPLPPPSLVGPCCLDASQWGSSADTLRIFPSGRPGILFFFFFLVRGRLGEGLSSSRRGTEGKDRRLAKSLVDERGSGRLKMKQ